MLDNLKLLTGQGLIFHRPKHPVPEAFRMADGGDIRTKTAPSPDQEPSAHPPRMIPTSILTVPPPSDNLNRNNLKRTSKRRQKKESSMEPTTEE
ncbi:hypothetical protein BGX31_002280, partial [Mortierella sp. GBA43]